MVGVAMAEFRLPFVVSRTCETRVLPIDLFAPPLAVQRHLDA